MQSTQLSLCAFVSAGPGGGFDSDPEGSITLTDGQITSWYALLSRATPVGVRGRDGQLAPITLTFPSATARGRLHITARQAPLLVGGLGRWQRRLSGAGRPEQGDRFAASSPACNHRSIRFGRGDARPISGVMPAQLRRSTCIDMRRRPACRRHHHRQRPKRFGLGVNGPRPTQSTKIRYPLNATRRNRLSSYPASDCALITRHQANCVEIGVPSEVRCTHSVPTSSRRHQPRLRLMRTEASGAVMPTRTRITRDIRLQMY